ncbi:hypothetical protein LUZ61_007735 [Rhynchospora tenuis]|uniref:AAA+ ATPase domain-containing protein n=1 Tax=Rhynchospora tenuis TaxID=198213 RepID=A0AAD5ZU00_9POAL|nr:hypothetical protein LUZ61_007735 [Rhynchospora tenuis]
MLVNFDLNFCISCKRNVKHDQYYCCNAAKTMETIGWSVLETYGRDLTKEAIHREPIFGRDKEIDHLARCLQKRDKSSAILMGDPGVGKTAIVEGLAQKIVSKTAPAALLDCRIISIDMGGMLSNTAYRGTFEKKFERLIEELTESKGRIILFIDEIHMVVGAGRIEGNHIDAANIFKPSLARGDFRCVGATTVEEYTRYVLEDSAFARRFEVIKVEEPTVTEAITMMTCVAASFEKYYGVSIDIQAVSAAVHMSVRYLPHLRLPDKAKDVLENACLISGAQPKVEAPKVEKAAGRKIPLLGWPKKKSGKQIPDKKDGREVEEEQNQQKSEENLSSSQLVKEEQNASSSKDPEPIVSIENVGKAISDMIGFSIFLGVSEKEELVKLEERICEQVVGQHHVIQPIVTSILKARAGLSDQTKPVGCFLLIGRSAVGKTELAKTLAREIFHDEKNLITMNMADYSDKSGVSRLLGSPGHAGTLTEMVRQRPFSVLHFDKIENSSKIVLNVLIGMINSGTLTDGGGRRINISNMLILMSSNIDIEIDTEIDIVPTNTEEGNERGEKKASNLSIEDQVKDRFGNDLVETVELLLFNKLSYEDMKKILEKKIFALSELIGIRGITLEVDPSVPDHILSHFLDMVDFGAVEKWLNGEFKVELLKKMMSTASPNPSKIIIKVSNGNLEYSSVV